MVFESLDEGLRKVVEYGTVDVDKEGENYIFKYDEDIFGNTCKEPVKITEQVSEATSWEYDIYASHDTRSILLTRRFAPRRTNSSRPT